MEQDDFIIAVPTHGHIFIDPAKVIMPSPPCSVITNNHHNQASSLTALCAGSDTSDCDVCGRSVPS